MSELEIKQIETGWYCFSVFAGKERKILKDIEGYLARNSYPDKEYLLYNNKISTEFTLRRYISDLGLPEQFEWKDQRTKLMYSQYIFLEIKECNVLEFNDFLQILKRIPGLIAVVGSKIDVRKNKRIKPAQYKIIPSVLSKKELERLHEKADKFSLTKDHVVAEVYPGCYYHWHIQGIYKKVRVLNVTGHDSCVIEDKSLQIKNAKISDLREISGQRYLDLSNLV